MANFQIAFVNPDATVLSDGVLVKAYTADISHVLIESAVIGAGAAPQNQGSAAFTLLNAGTEYSFEFPNINIAPRKVTLPSTPFLIVGTPGSGASSLVVDTTLNTSTELFVYDNKAFVPGQAVALNAIGTTTTYFGLATASGSAFLPNTATPNPTVTVNFISTSVNGIVSLGLSGNPVVLANSVLTFGNPPVSNNAPSSAFTTLTNYGSGSNPNPIFSGTYAGINIDVPVVDASGFSVNDTLSFVFADNINHNTGFNGFLATVNSINANVLTVTVLGLYIAINGSPGNDVYGEANVKKFIPPINSLTATSTVFTNSVNNRRFNINVFDGTNIANGMSLMLSQPLNTNDTGYPLYDYEQIFVLVVGGGGTNTLTVLSHDNDNYQNNFVGISVYPTHSPIPSPFTTNFTNFNGSTATLHFGGGFGGASVFVQYYSDTGAVGSQNFDILNYVSGSSFNSPNFTVTVPDTATHLDVSVTDIFNNYKYYPTRFYVQDNGTITNNIIIPTIPPVTAPISQTPTIANGLTLITNGQIQNGNGIDTTFSVQDPGGNNVYSTSPNIQTGSQYLAIPVTFTKDINYQGSNTQQTLIKSFVINSNALSLCYFDAPELWTSVNGEPGVKVANLDPKPGDFSGTWAPNITPNLSIPNGAVNFTYYIYIPNSVNNSFAGFIEATSSTSDSWGTNSTNGNVLTSTTGASGSWSPLTFLVNGTAIGTFGPSISNNFVGPLDSIVFVPQNDANTIHVYALDSSDMSRNQVNSYSNNGNNLFSFSFIAPAIKKLIYEFTASNSSGESAPSNRITWDPVTFTLAWD